MNTTERINPDFEKLTRSAFFFDKVHPCTDCPIRKLAIKRPQSLFARLHNWHKTWWPGWKAHQTRECPFSAKAKTQA